MNAKFLIAGILVVESVLLRASSGSQSGCAPPWMRCPVVRPGCDRALEKSSVQAWTDACLHVGVERGVASGDLLGLDQRYPDPREAPVGFSMERLTATQTLRVPGVI